MKPGEDQENKTARTATAAQLAYQQRQASSTVSMDSEPNSRGSFQRQHPSESSSASSQQSAITAITPTRVTTTSNASTTDNKQTLVLQDRRTNVLADDGDNLSIDEGDDTLGALQDEVDSLKKSLENEKSKLNDVPCKYGWRPIGGQTI